MLDDASIVSFIQIAANGTYGKATDLAMRYLRRDLYKSIELPRTAAGRHSAVLAARFFDGLKTERIEHINDVLPAKLYKQYDVMEPSFVKNILVKRDDDYDSLGEVSEAVKTLPTKTLRVYFTSEADRARARVILEAAR